jgi:flavodoxin
VTTGLPRRQLILGGLLGGAGAVASLAGCSSARQAATSQTPEGRPTVTATPGADAKTLLVYFSRAGENYFNGGRRTLAVGNTEVLATMIEDQIGCDVYRVEAEEPYSESYDETVRRNVEEQEADARPAIARPLPDLGSYDTILLGSPVWNVRAPMIMWTFTDGVDLTGKAVLPFVTYAVSGIGTVEDDYRDTLRGAEVRPGLAIKGETVGDAGAQVDAWLRDHRLLT